LAAVEHLHLLELGAEHARELNWLEGELANVRAALTWFAETGESEALLQLAGALWPFWYFHTHLEEGRRWLTRALTGSPEVSPALHARALHGAGQLAHWQGDDAQAVPLFEKALALWREAGDRRGTALALMLLGIVAEHRGDYEAARPYLEEATALYQAEGAAAWVALAGSFHLGIAAFGQGDYAQAQVRLEDALARFREADNRWGEGISLCDLGFLAYQRGDLPGAASRYGECLAVLPENRSTETTVECLLGLASLATKPRPDLAARLFGVASVLAEPSRHWLPQFERIAFESAQQATCAALGEPGYSLAYHALRNVTLDEAIAEGNAALTLLRPHLQAASLDGSDPPASSALTSRELDVLRLIVAGHRDQEIADALYLSRRTVQTHVTHLFTKLGVNTRAEAAAVAVRQGLV
jgi:non-specific serine/threonine protein kinase